MSEEPHRFRTVRLSVDGGVAVAEIDNPPVNLITADLFRDLRALPDHLEDRTDARVLVLRSANPDFFIAHYDVEQILSFPVDGPAERGSELGGFHKMVERYRTMPIPTICEITGRVGGGGGELAASCDMRFGTDTTMLCQMEVPLGILPGGSGTQRLPLLLGRGRAMEIVLGGDVLDDQRLAIGRCRLADLGRLSACALDDLARVTACFRDASLVVLLGGDDIDGPTLERWGWLNRMLPPTELGGFVDRLAARIAGFPPQAVARAKASVLAASPDPTPGLLTEAHLFQETIRHPSSQERMRAFLDRGGHTPDGELRVGALGAELGAAEGGDR